MEVITLSTIRDVATAAKVSAATVSRILKNDPTLSVSPHTRSKVLEAAEKLSYKINAPKDIDRIGKVLITNWYTKQVSLSDLYFRSIRWGAETALKSSGYEVHHMYFNEKFPKLTQIDGIIAVGEFEDDDIKRLKETKKPFIVLNQDTLEQDVSCVIPDFESSVFKVLDYLSNYGKEKVGLLTAKTKKMKRLDPRTLAYIDYVKKHDIYDKDVIFSGDFSTRSGYEQMEKAIKSLNKLPSSFFVISDTIAIGAIKALQKNHIKIPNEVQIVGFEDLDVGKYLTPSLSTVRIATRDIGIMGVLTLEQLIKGMVTTPVKVNVKNKLIIRESSKKRM